jgi:hypothetical protein
VIGMPVLSTSEFADGELDETQFSKMEDEWFHRPIEFKLFSPPHLLVKEHETFPLVLRMEGAPLLFRDKIVGFSAPDTPADRKELQRLHEFLRDNRESAQFFAAFGPQYLIFRMGTPLKKSLMDLPYPEDGKVLFRGVQNHLRDDVLNFMIPLIKDNQRTQAELARDAKSKEVGDYVKVFLEVMRSAFPDLKSSGKPVDLGRAWLVAFHRGDDPAEALGDTEALVKHLDGLLVKDMGRSLRCWRIVRHFHGKSLYILKPKPRRYWLKSAAVRDADEMFAWWAAQSTKKAKPYK